MKRSKFKNGEYYHVYNRGVDKRDVFLDEGDFERFLRSLVEFNRVDPIGSLADLEEKIHSEFRSESNSLMKVKIANKIALASNPQLGIGSRKDPLVELICYCLNPNHFHFILRQLIESGISKFMQKLGMGYTNYFNLKNNRSGVLFQGKFKAVKIESNEHLLWVSAYVNANAQIHGLTKDAANYKWCSYPEYLGLSPKNFCHKDMIIEQFKDKENFKSFMNDCILSMKEKKELQKFLID